MSLLRRQAHPKNSLTLATDGRYRAGHNALTKKFPELNSGVQMNVAGQSPQVSHEDRQLAASARSLLSVASNVRGSRRERDDRMQVCRLHKSLRVVRLYETLMGA